MDRENNDTSRKIVRSTSIHHILHSLSLPLPKWSTKAHLHRISFPFAAIHDSDKILISETGSGGSILKLHEDVQTCGYKDVQVMFEILTTELDVSSKQHHRKRPPPVWSGRRSSSMIAAAQ
jgi:hypothetical protein